MQRLPSEWWCQRLGERGIGHLPKALVRQASTDPGLPTNELGLKPSVSTLGRHAKPFSRHLASLLALGALEY